MQRYFAGELRPDQEESWKAEDGIFYLVSGVDAALAEKEENWNKIVEVWQMKLNTQNDQIASLLKKLERSNDAWIGGQQQIATLKEALETLIAFIPVGWEMPLGYIQVVAQAQVTIKGEMR